MGKTYLVSDSETIALIIAALEKRTGLQLVNLSQAELNAKLRQWMTEHPEENKTS